MTSDDFHFVDNGVYDYVDDSLPEVKPSNSVDSLRIPLVESHTPDKGTKLGDNNYSPQPKQTVNPSKGNEDKTTTSEQVNNLTSPTERKEVSGSIPSKIKDIKHDRDVSDRQFWKVLTIIMWISLVLLGSFFLSTAKSGSFKSDIQPLTEVNNSYSFNPSISTPVNSQVSNQYNNSYSINFDLDKEFINKFCNNS